MFPSLDRFPCRVTPDQRLAVIATGSSGALASIVGVARALEEAGVHPAVVSVCSESSLFGFPIGAGIPANEVAAFTAGLRPEEYVDLDWPTLASARADRWPGLCPADARRQMRRVTPMTDVPSRLGGRVVLITGAASGIGRETALRAASEGARIAAIGLDASALEALVDEVAAMGQRAAARPVDVSDPDALTAAIYELVSELGPLSVAHANAGVLTHPSSISDLELAEWNRVLAVDLTGVMLTFRAALPHFNPGGGLLLATGSSLAVRPGVGYLPYVAAKAGVHAIARSLSLELAPRHIRVNVIAPGLTETPMTLGVPGHIERQLQTVPLGELVERERCGCPGCTPHDRRGALNHGERVHDRCRANRGLIPNPLSPTSPHRRPRSGRVGAEYLSGRDDWRFTPGRSA